MGTRQILLQRVKTSADEMEATIESIAAQCEKRRLLIARSDLQAARRIIEQLETQKWPFRSSSAEYKTTISQIEVLLRTVNEECVYIINSMNASRARN